MSEKFFVRRVPGDEVTQIVRINSKEDIPEIFCNRGMCIRDGMIWYYHKPQVPIGSFLIYSYLEPVLCDWKFYEELLEDMFEIDGKFYRKSPVLQAYKIDWESLLQKLPDDVFEMDFYEKSSALQTHKNDKELPDFLKKARFSRYADGTLVLMIYGGVALIKPDTTGYIIFHKYCEDGTSIVGVIHKWQYKDYIVCDEQGEFLRKL